MMFVVYIYAALLLLSIVSLVCFHSVLFSAIVFGIAVFHLLLLLAYNWTKK